MQLSHRVHPALHLTPPTSPPISCENHETQPASAVQRAWHTRGKQSWISMPAAPHGTVHAHPSRILGVAQFYKRQCSSTLVPSHFDTRTPTSRFACLQSGCPVLWRRALPSSDHFVLFCSKKMFSPNRPSINRQGTMPPGPIMQHTH